MSVAEARIKTLARLARQTAPEDEALARSYVRLARRVAERTRTPLPKQFRRFTCDACDRYQRPGETVRVRLQRGHVVYACQCGAQARYPYDTEP